VHEMGGIRSKALTSQLRVSGAARARGVGLAPRARGFYFFSSTARRRRPAEGDPAQIQYIRADRRQFMNMPLVVPAAALFRRTRRVCPCCLGAIGSQIGVHDCVRSAAFWHCNLSRGQLFPSWVHRIRRAVAQTRRTQRSQIAPRLDPFSRLPKLEMHAG